MSAALDPNTVVTLASSIGGPTLTFEAQKTPSDPSFFTLVDIPGWYDQTQVDLDTENLPGQHGAFPPEDPTYGPRTIQVTADMTGPPGSDIRTLFWEKFSRLGLGPDRLTVTDAFGTLYSDTWLMGTPSFKLGAVTWIGRMTLNLYAPDPRKYRYQGGTIETQPGGVGGVIDGLAFPLIDTATGGLDFGTFAVSGGFYLHNSGTIESWPMLTVRGGLPGGFSLVSNIDSLVFSADVPNGQQCVLSPYAGGRAILNGVDRTDALVPVWTPVQPGETRLYVFSALGSPDTAARCFTDMRDAFI